MGYILYGAGRYGREMYDLLKGIDVKCFIDSNLGGSHYGGVSVYFPSDLDMVYDQEDEIVLCTRDMKNGIEMSEVLKEHRLKYRLMDDIADEVVFGEARIYNEKNKRETMHANVKNMWSCPWDRIRSNGSMDAYFWQDLWAAKKIYNVRPSIHYDIGSRIDGLIAHLLSFGQKVKVIDIRNIQSYIDGLDFVQADATQMENFKDNKIESLSAVCSVEHFGLGRYTDEIDPDACFIFLNEISKKIIDGGYFYLTVPIGKERVQFNAHRVFYPSTIVNELRGMKCDEFSVYEDGRIIENADLSAWDSVENYGAIGLFAFKKE